VSLLQKITLGIAHVVTALLVVFCLIGAFLGTERAARLFVSAPMSLLWAGAAVGVVLAVAAWPGLRRSPGGPQTRFIAFGNPLLVLHLSLLLILVGAFLGSEAGLRARQMLLHDGKVRRGLMVLTQGHAQSRVLCEPVLHETALLPFELRLDAFVIECYEPGGPAKSYISHVSVLREGRVVTTADISVNHPFHYGGYYFYQYSYDVQGEPQSVLMVGSDAGLAPLQVGLVLLAAGTFMHFWLGPVRMWVANRYRRES